MALFSASTSVCVVALLFSFIAPGIVHAGAFLICNQCDSERMTSAAVSRGAGEHLVANIDDQRGLVVRVSCSKRRDQSKPPECRAEDSHWKALDQHTLDLLIDSMGFTGQWSIHLELHLTDSIYDLARNPGYSLVAIADSIPGRVNQHPGFAAEWSNLRRWSEAYSHFASVGQIRLNLKFIDGSMAVRVSTAWLAKQVEIGLGDIEIMKYTARDNSGNPVPNLTGGPDLNGASFSFPVEQRPPPGWRQLVEHLGYSVSAVGVAVQWVCSGGPRSSDRACNPAEQPHPRKGP